jgi:hypothetical protein
VANPTAPPHYSIVDKAFMNLGTPPAMKIGGGRSMMTPSSVTEGRSRLGAINPR